MKNFPKNWWTMSLTLSPAFENTADLSTCGGVCSRWLHRSRSHLFSHITLSNTTVRRFMNLVDGSSVPILSFVQSLDMHFVRGSFAQDQVARLQICTALTNLCIHVPGSHVSFERWLQRNIPRFGAACLSLAHLELVGLGNHVPLHVIVDVVLALPALTHLRICGGDSEYGHGLLGAETALATEAFPQHLHSLDVSLHRGMDLFFQWLLSLKKTPVFTSLKIGGRANGARIEPIDAYFQLVGPKIETLALEYWVDGGYNTYAFEERAMALTTNLVHLSRARQYPRSLPSHFYLLIFDWPAIDAALAAPQFANLRRISFTDQLSKKSVALMPQANARAILY
ncbi:hypothetical protein C8J57DRAFT_1280460 [Mycena rebaudengoi]|nr:hypothetical protein C8J57DRAFT_1280460 [Mycena rebaudengoi]